MKNYYHVNVDRTIVISQTFGVVASSSTEAEVLAKEEARNCTSWPHPTSAGTIKVTSIKKDREINQ